MYQLFQASEDSMEIIRQSAAMSNKLIQTYFDLPGPVGAPARSLAAWGEMVDGGRITHSRPDFCMPPISTDRIRLAIGERLTNMVPKRDDESRLIQIVDTPVVKTPFCTLTHFQKKWPTDIHRIVEKNPQEQVLIVAPMSGHFATLLHDTIETMLPDYDVFITDWANARDVPLSCGKFGFDDYTQVIIDFMAHLRPGSHLIAVCQPAVQALCAAVVMESSYHPSRPASLTLIAGPLDTDVNASAVDKFAHSHDLAWFQRSLISAVPARYKGAGRLVYPGFMQLGSFISMNINRHIFAALHQMSDIVLNQVNAVNARRSFYHEYFAVMDMPAEFYLETIEKVFQNNDLRYDRLVACGRTIDLSALKQTRLIIIEGENDDICPPGQTSAIIKKCDNLNPTMITHHVQKGVGHYGCFSGSKWRSQIYPVIDKAISHKIKNI